MSAVPRVFDWALYMRRFGSSWGTDAGRSLKPQSSISLLIRDADALMPSFDSKTMERPSYHVHASPVPRPQLPAKPSLYNFNYRVPTHHPPQTPLCVPAYYRGDRALVHTSRTGSPHGTTNLDVDVHMSTLIWTQMLDHLQDMYAQRKTSPSHTHTTTFQYTRHEPRSRYPSVLPNARHYQHRPAKPHSRPAQPN
jgi:hypothetical protein